MTWLLSTKEAFLLPGQPEKKDHLPWSEIIEAQQDSGLGTALP